MFADITNLNQIGVLRGVLGQEMPAITPPADTGPPVVRTMSYEEAHRRLFGQCKTMLSEEGCIKLIGSSPFVCDTVTSKVWFWLALGAGAGVALARVMGK